jgi:hypothetical protein
MKTMKKMLLVALVLVFASLSLWGCATREGKPQGEPETRPTLYYQGQKYDLLHSEANKIDVGGFLIKQYGPIGMMRYPGEVLFEDFDTSDARRAGDEVYVHPEDENALIYRCGDCNEYFCITTEFVQPMTVEASQDPINTDVGAPRPSIYYDGSWRSMDHYDGNLVDIEGRKLEYINITRYVGLKGSQDFDVNYETDAGYAVYTDPKQPDILIYHCDHCDEYFSISLD